MICKFCGSELKNEEVFVCPVCNNVQNKSNLFKLKHSLILDILKFSIGVFLIPLFILFYNNIDKEKAAEVEHSKLRASEIRSSVASIKTQIHLMYEPCLSSDLNSCSDLINNNYANYQSSISSLEVTISDYFPELTSVVTLLSTTQLRLSREARELWREFSNCTKSNDIDICTNEWRRHPLKNLVIGRFIVDYLDCKVKKLLQDELKSDLSDHCKIIIEVREPYVLTKSNEILSTFDGFRFEKRFDQLIDQIWSDFIEPGSGLVYSTDEKVGYVKFKFDIGIDGFPENISILESFPAGKYDDFAIKHIKNTKFNAKMEKDGRPIKKNIIYTLNINDKY